MGYVITVNLLFAVITTPASVVPTKGIPITEVADKT